MDRKNLALNMPYKDKLNDEERQRYLSKIADIDGLDPYEHTEWIEDDFELLPPLTRLYLIEGTRFYTFNSFHSETSLPAHVYFTSGWVHTLQIHSVNKRTVIRAMIYQVKHSESVGLKAKPLEPWVILQDDGSVISAHCTCVAGPGESCCSHVAALLFKIECIVRLRHKKTEKKMWHKKTVTEKKMFDEAASGERELGKRSRGFLLLPIEPFSAADTDLLPIMLKRKSICLSTFPEYCHLYLDPVKPCVVPKSLKTKNKTNKSLNSTQRARNSKTVQTAKLYCICRGSEDGTMVRCDTLRCAIKWFHVRCVLSHVPKKGEKWYCATCTENKRK